MRKQKEGEGEHEGVKSRHSATADIFLTTPHGFLFYSSNFSQNLNVFSVRMTRFDF